MIATKVLLADKDADFADATKIMLSHKHISVSVATSSEQALTLLELTPDFDVVLYDAHFLDSESFSRLRQIQMSFPAIKIVLLACRDTLEPAIKGMEWGVFDYLLKPYDPKELFAKIEEAKTRTRQQRDRMIDAGSRALRQKWEKQEAQEKKISLPTDS